MSFSIIFSLFLYQPENIITKLDSLSPLIKSLYTLLGIILDSYNVSKVLK